MRIDGRPFQLLVLPSICPWLERISVCDGDSSDGGVYASCVYSVGFCSSVRPATRTLLPTTETTARTIVASTTIRT